MGEVFLGWQQILFVADFVLFIFSKQISNIIEQGQIYIFFFSFFSCKGSENGSVGHGVSVVPTPSCVLAVPEQPQIL